MTNREYNLKVQAGELPVPHGILKGIGNGKRKCIDCGAEGIMSGYMGLNGDDGAAISCTSLKAMKPCPHCGEYPICSETCPGIMEVLSSPETYIAGLDPEKPEQNQN